MSQNGISTEVVYVGTSTVVDPIATKIKRRADKLALAQCTRSHSIYGYRPLNHISGTHQSYVNGANGPSLQTLSGTASPSVGHPWSTAPAFDVVITRSAELGSSQQIEGITYVTSATTFVSNGVATDPSYGSSSFFLKSFSTATSDQLTTILGNPATTSSQYHSGLFYAQWAASSSAPSSFVQVSFAVAPVGDVNNGNPNGTSINFDIQDDQGNETTGTWIFPVVLTLVEQYN